MGHSQSTRLGACQRAVGAAALAAPLPPAPRTLLTATRACCQPPLAWRSTRSSSTPTADSSSSTCGIRQGRCSLQRIACLLLLAARTPVVASPARRRSLAAFVTDTSTHRATSNQKTKRAVAARHTAHRLGPRLRHPQHPGAVRYHHVRRDLAYYVQERAELAPRLGKPCLRPWHHSLLGLGGGDAGHRR